MFIEEIPERRVITIEGVPTSTAAFVGRTWRGPRRSTAITLESFVDYERQFGGLWRDSTLSFAVKQFFENGGTQAIVVRVATRCRRSVAKAATITLDRMAKSFAPRAPEAGASISSVTIDHAGIDLKPGGQDALQSDRDGRHREQAAIQKSAAAAG